MQIIKDFVEACEAEPENFETFKVNNKLFFQKDYLEQKILERYNKNLLKKKLF